MSSKIEAIMIFEVLGKPPEHLVETLEDIIKRIGQEKGLKVTEKKVNEPRKFKEDDDIYTTFAEVSIESDNTLALIAVLFKFMPANVEIISPENINMKNLEWNEIINEVARRLHGYDEVARVLQTENMILERKLKEILCEKDDRDIEG